MSCSSFLDTSAKAPILCCSNTFITQASTCHYKGAVSLHYLCSRVVLGNLFSPLEPRQSNRRCLCTTDSKLRTQGNGQGTATIFHDRAFRTEASAVNVVYYTTQATTVPKHANRHFILCLSLVQGGTLEEIRWKKAKPKRNGNCSACFRWRVRCLRQIESAPNMKRESKKIFVSRETYHNLSVVRSSCALRGSQLCIIECAGAGKKHGSEKA